MSKWLKPENEVLLAEAVRNNKSIAGVCRDLGLVPRGGNIATVRNHIVRLGLSVDHHTGQGWNKENYKEPSQTKRRSTLRKSLIRTYGYKCWKCELSEWMGEPIPLELDHIDGDSTNNELSNLRILCCNCHAQTPTFRNKRRT